MALHTQLPIYKVAYDLFHLVVDYLQNAPRTFKALLGTHIGKLAAELLTLIFAANCAEDKQPYLQALIERIEQMNLFLRLMRDKRHISIPQYAAAVELTTSVAKQAIGWRNYYAVSPAT